MRKALLIMVLGLMVLMGSAEARSNIGFSSKWYNRDVDFNRYKELYIHNIDLRQMLIEDYDEDEDEADIEGINERAIEKIGYTVYKIFSERLKRIITIADIEQETADLSKEKSLMLNIKLSAKFSYDNGRILQEWVRKMKGVSAEPVPLSIQCTLVDSQTNEKIVTLYDTQDLTDYTTDDPFTRESDFIQLRNYLDVWAGQLATLIEKQRTKPGYKILKPEN